MPEPTVAKLKAWARKNRSLGMTVAKAQAFAQVERARVDAYTRPLFATFAFTDADDGTPLTDPRKLYLSNDDEGCARYYAACDEAHRANGFTGEAGTCPALVAESLQTKAENLLLDSLAAFGGLEAGAYNRTLEMRAKALDLALSCTLGNLS